MRIALASPRVATTLDEGLEKVRRLVAEAAARGAEVVCFPEAYLPGLHGVDIDVPPFEQADHARVLRTVAEWARGYRVATILSTERLTPAGRQIAAYVFDTDGRVQGCQSKTQLAPSEDPFYVP